MGPVSEEFKIGQKVRVKTESRGTNRRVPEYAKGATGTIVRSYGVVTGHQHDHAKDWGPLYNVLLDPASGFSGEKLLLDIHDSWLEDADAGASVVDE
jgi:hypothetical protein